MSKIYWLYQRAMWYSRQGVIEIMKPLALAGLYATVITGLAVYGFHFTWYIILAGYIWLMLAACVLGYVLQESETIKYNNTLGNKQNAELMKILEKLENIENELRK